MLRLKGLFYMRMFVRVALLCLLRDGLLRLSLCTLDRVSRIFGL